jgi:alkaline phosphatase D
MGMDRRRFLRVGSAGAVGVTGGLLSLAGCTLRHPGAPPAPEGETAFQHGVASGDPLRDRVILWTRVSPPASGHTGPIGVAWWIARDAGGAEVVREGRVEARADRDFTVKVDVEGLEPATCYFYGFRLVNREDASPVGRTKTLGDEDVAELRLAFTSCSNYPAGHFNGYAHIARQDDLDAVLHLGDYLYEYGNGEYGDGTALGRVPDPLHEIVSLEDYRRRHATYKRDPALQAAHARHPWITIWDDHESANDAHRRGAENHTPESEGDWERRRLSAIRAYYEWMPIRELPTGLFRRFRVGRLLDLVLLDTRLHARDPRVEPGDVEAAKDPLRTLLGRDQTGWLLDALDASRADGIRWRLIGQQVVFSPSAYGASRFNPDAWDGYRANRTEITSHLVEEGIENVLILTGDVHSSWVFEVPGSEAPGADPVAVELVTPAISSPPLGQRDEIRAQVEAATDRLEHLVYRDLTAHGYLRLEIEPERVRARYLYTDPVDRTSSVARLGAAFEITAGRSRAVRIDRARSAG